MFFNISIEILSQAVLREFMSDITEIAKCEESEPKMC